MNHFSCDHCGLNGSGRFLARVSRRICLTVGFEVRVDADSTEKILTSESLRQESQKHSDSYHENC